MKTKVTILGESTVEQPKKKIEFVKWLSKDDTIKQWNENSCMKPDEWDNIELICNDYKDTGFDLMYAYRGDRNQDATLYLGNFNDGVV